MRPDEIVNKTRHLLEQERARRLQEQAPITEKKTCAEVDFVLPVCEEGQFLIPIEWDEGKVIFCLRELFWHEALDIDAMSFRSNEHDKAFFSEEFERRETLKLAICWVAELQTREIKHNDKNILRCLNYEAIELLWKEYKPLVSVSLSEANQLAEATRAYLMKEAQEGYPVPSIVVETCAMCDGFCAMSRNEFRNILDSDFQRMEIIKMQRAEVMGLGGVRTPVIEPQLQSPPVFDAMEHARKMYPIGHPNRPPGI